MWYGPTDGYLIHAVGFPPTAIVSAVSPKAKSTKRKRSWSFYAWVLVVLGVAVTAVILGWHSQGGTTDPSVPANAVHMSRTTAVINSADKGCCHHLIDYIAMLSPPVFNASKPTWTADETQCATCIVTLRV